MCEYELRETLVELSLCLVLREHSNVRVWFCLISPCVNQDEESKLDFSDINCIQKFLLLLFSILCIC